MVLNKLWGLPPALDMDYEKRVQCGDPRDGRRRAGGIGARSERRRPGGGAGGVLLRTASARRSSSIRDLRPEVRCCSTKAPSRILISTANPEAVAADRARSMESKRRVVGVTIEKGFEIRSGP